MGRQMKGLFYFYWTNMRYSLIIFWAVLISIVLFSLMISYILRAGDGFMMIVLAGPFYVYFSIYGFTLVKNWLPFLIKLGATRKHIYTSLIIYFTGLAMSFSLVALLIEWVTKPIITGLNIEIFSYFHLAYYFNNQWYEKFLIDLALCLFLFVFFFLLGLLKYRYGLLVTSGIGLLAFVMFILGIVQGWLGDVFVKLFANVNLSLIGITLISALVLYGLSWLFLRQITLASVR